MSDIVLHADCLSKRYRIGARRERYDTARDTLAAALKAPFEWMRRGPAARTRGAVTDIWALRDVSFDVRRGEVVGVIGRNGAGKSTLLKILSRITEPTSGFADVTGRVGSLLEVGTGFHLELTGRENVYLNGAILGMTRAEIDRTFDRIVDFAEVAQFVDTPVKHYSSGMHLRLAFSVAAHLQVDVLMVDEVLAVGDLAFQNKCLGKMEEVAANGRTVLFVSHNLPAIERFTSRSFLIEQGQLRFAGATSEALKQYTALQTLTGIDIVTRTDRQGDGLIRVESIDYRDADGAQLQTVPAGAPVTIVVRYRSRVATLAPRDLTLDLRVTDSLGTPVTTFSTRFAPVGALTSPSPWHQLECHVPTLALAADRYYLDLWLAYRGGVSDFVTRAAILDVTPSDYFGTGHVPSKQRHGPALLNHQWVAAPDPTEETHGAEVAGART